jgi:CubicO group peptidase (beta-lactamase class C family)
MWPFRHFYGMPPTDVLLESWVGRSTPGAAYVHFDRTRVIHEHYAGLADVATQRPVDARTTFHGFSVTKTFTALAVVQLAQARRVDLNELVRSYLPTMPYAGDIRLRHVLTHTAGLPNPLPLSWVHTPEEDARFDRDAFFATVVPKHTKLRSAPGERFAYSNLGYVLLGQLIERITGVRYEEAIRRAILEPAGIRPPDLGFTYPTDNTHATGYLRTPSLLSFILPLMFDTHRHLGERTGRWRSFKPFLLNGAAYGGTLGTATGYRQYLQALLTDGALLQPAWRERLFTECITNNGQRTGMAMGWFTGTLNGHAYVAHAGGGGGYYAEIRLYPALGRGSVVLFNRTGLRDERLLDRLDSEVPSGG